MWYITQVASYNLGYNWGGGGGVGLCTGLPKGGGGGNWGNLHQARTQEIL